MAKPDNAGAGATDYMHLFGLVALGRFHNPESGLLVISIQSFLVRQNGLTILVDCCGGNDKDRVRPHFHRQKRPWLDTLRAAGAAPEDIDIVLCTHLHVDHVGWNTRLENGRWVPTFPNARYLIAQREWDYWRNAGPAALQRTGDFIADSVLPIVERGQADMIGDEHAIRSDISVEPAHGHTPGQKMLRLSGANIRPECLDEARTSSKRQSDAR
jgi:glyoxylase-like metal-dependent hydrolase (beta-lactamase superfamily II)